MNPVAWRHNLIDDCVVQNRPSDIDRHPDRWTALYENQTPCQTCEALARTVMLDQTSHDTKKEWANLTVEERATLRTAYRNNLSGLISAVQMMLKEKNT